MQFGVNGQQLLLKRKMMDKNKTLLNYLRFFAFLYISMVIIGIYNNYSPVPNWDMWNGYLEFYTKVQNGDWYAWIAQHNEHRIFLSRILFWIDLHFFSGTLYFLLFCNFILIVTIVYLFSKFIKHLFLDDQKTQLYLLYTVAILSFSWIQNNNITWGFQSQFFLAYLIPLLSFYLLGKFVITGKVYFYIYSIIAGIFSVFTMGNGILALPILLLLANVLKISKEKQLVILLIGVITLSLYFIDYTAPAGHGSLMETISQHPKDFFLYILTYSGGPFGYIVGNSQVFLIQIFGLLFILSSLYFTYKAFKLQKNKALVFGLLAFIMYIGGTAFGTAGGRALFGIEQATSSRYMTPTLMGWSALLILFIYFQNNPKTIKYIRVLFFIIPFIFLYQQSRSLKHHPYTERILASLALELSIHDGKYLGHIFPNSTWLMQHAKKPREKNLSIFGNDLISDIALKIDSEFGTIPLDEFQGSVDKVKTIENELKYNRVTGWIFDNKNNTVPKSAFLINKKGFIIGYVITGLSRPDVKEVVGKKAEFSGFYGYMLKGYQGKDFYVVNKKHNKKLKVNLAVPPFTYKKYNNQKLVSNKDILSSSFEEDKEYNNQALDGIQIYGSFVNGDTTKASIKVSLKNNNQLLYKTGPNSNGQLINIYDKDKLIYNSSLKVSKEWKLIAFDVSKKNLIVEIIDNSSLWGEWSAIALKSENEPK